MSKRRTISHETFNHLLASGSETQVDASRFTVHGGVSPVTIEIPTYVVYRIFRVGQGYRSHYLSRLSPEVKVIIGSIDIVAFTLELHQLLALVNDQALHDHVNRLLEELEAPPGPSGKSIAVSVGSIDEKRA